MASSNRIRSPKRLRVFGDVGTIQNIWLRADWLEKLGLSKPTTLQEFKDVCIAFRDQDPDGNGQNDTLALAIDNNFENGLNALMAAYGAYPNIWIEAEDGTLVYGGIQPEVKSALAELNDWYNQGIVSSEWMTTDRNTMKAQLVNGTAGACLYASHIGYSLGVSLIENNPDARLLPIALPSATNEPTVMGVKFPVSSYLVVSKDCKNPEAAIKCLNVYSDISENGSVEEIATYLDNSVGGASAPFRTNNPNADFNQHIGIAEAERAGDSSKLKPDAMAKFEGVMKWKNEQDPIGYGDYLQQSLEGGYAQLVSMVNENRIIHDALKGPQTQTMVEKWSSLETMIDEAFTLIVSGQKPLDYFDEFVAKWKDLGGDQITIEMNAEYGK